MSEIIEITRHGNIPGHGVLGTLKFGSLEFKTIEREWLDNKPSVSCIPAGVYSLVPHRWRGTYPTYALVSEGGDGSVGYLTGKRTYILFHPANVQSEIEGCIGIGRAFFCLKGFLGVSESGPSTKAVLEAIESAGHENVTVHIIDRGRCG